MCQEMITKEFRLERINNASLIPLNYVEQLRDREFEVSRFYQYMDVVSGSPTSLLYLVMSDKNVVCGYVWATVNLLENVLWINHVSVDRELWHTNIFETFLHGQFFDLLKSLDLKKCRWSSTRARAFSKFGYYKSPLETLEYTVE